MIWFTIISLIGISLLVYSAFRMDKSPSVTDRMGSFIPGLMAMGWAGVLGSVWLIWFIILLVRIQKVLD